MTKWTEFLRGHNGGLEINRLVGFVGGIAYIGSAIGFEAWRISQGHEFNVTEFCLAFSGGLTIIVGGTAGAVALKDRQTAAAGVIAATGSKPATPPNPAPVVNHELDNETQADDRPSYAK